MRSWLQIKRINTLTIWYIGTLIMRTFFAADCTFGHVDIISVGNEVRKTMRTLTARLDKRHRRTIILP